MQIKHTLNSKSRTSVIHSGFTLVELLIVIAIIGILAAIIIVTYNKTIQSSQVASLQSDLGTAAGQLNVDNGANGSYPATAVLANNGAGLKPSSGTVFTYTYSTLDNSFCLIGVRNGVSYYVAEGINNPAVGTVCPPRVTTFAGSGTGGFADGTGSGAQFYYPFGLAVDSSGTLYVGDYSNSRIRKITSAGVVTTLAGSSAYGFFDATGGAAQFTSPSGMAVDSSGNVYTADVNNNRIRKITAAGAVTTLAGSSTAGYAEGAGNLAQFNNVQGVAVNSSGMVYAADSSNQRIRQITSAGVVSTLAGSGVPGFADGTGAAAQFNNVQGLAVDSSGTIYVSDNTNNRIRKITPAGVVTTLAGSGAVGSADGTGAAAQFSNPSAIAVDSSGTIYVADSSNNRIRKITPAGVVTTLAGSGAQGFVDGAGSATQFNIPYGIAVNSSGSVYVADTFNHRIRKIQ